MSKNYTIYYSNEKQIGGHKNFQSNFTTYVPDYPAKLGISRSMNWPPSINLQIKIKDPKTPTVYEGSVIENIWNDTASVIKINDDQYVEKSLETYDKFNRGIGFFLLLPDYFWQPIDSKDPVFNQEQQQHSYNYNKHENNSYNISSRLNDPIDQNVDVKDYQQSKQDNNKNIAFSNFTSSIPKNHEILTKNKLYSPLLKDCNKDYFSDYKLDLHIYNNKY